MLHYLASFQQLGSHFQDLRMKRQISETVAIVFFKVGLEVFLHTLILVLISSYSSLKLFKLAFELLIGLVDVLYFLGKLTRLKHNYIIY